MTWTEFVFSTAEPALALMLSLLGVFTGDAAQDMVRDAFNEIEALSHDDVLRRDIVRNAVSLLQGSLVLQALLGTLVSYLVGTYAALNVMHLGIVFALVGTVPMFLIAALFAILVAQVGLRGLALFKVRNPLAGWLGNATLGLTYKTLFEWLFVIINVAVIGLVVLGKFRMTT